MSGEEGSQGGKIGGKIAANGWESKRTEFSETILVVS